MVVFFTRVHQPSKLGYRCGGIIQLRDRLGLRVQKHLLFGVALKENITYFPEKAELDSAD